MQLILHHFQYSLYSLMVRFTYALRNYQISSVSSSIDFRENVVDLHRDQHLSEQYLREINPNGQVPVLSVIADENGNNSSERHIRNSIDITCEICYHYPRLLPKTYRGIIITLLRELHAIQAFSLSVPAFVPNDETAWQNPRIQDLKNRDDTGLEYRKALEHKLKFHERTFSHSLTPEFIDQAKLQARTFFSHVLEQRQMQYIDVPTESTSQNDSNIWIFGPDVGPTALDAHMMPFIARLIDADNADLVPDELLHCAKKVMELDEWRSVSNGLPTMFEIVLREGFDKYPQALTKRR